jgi:site-specific recombinase XerD
MDLYFFDWHAATAPIFLDGIELVPGFSEYLRSAQPHLKPSLPFHESGMPIAVARDQNGVSSETAINCFLRYLRSDGVSLKTVADYGRDLVVFARFMDQMEKGLLEATTEDIKLYRSVRRDGDLNHRLQATSWQRSRTSMSRFFDWALDNKHISLRPSTNFRRDRLSHKGDIKMISLECYLMFRNVGLLGTLPNGTRDHNFRNRTPLRDAAFAELLVTTGLRLEEASSLLKLELPDSSSHAFANRRISETVIPSPITKGRRTRAVPFPRRVALQFIEPYIREERSIAVRAKRGGNVRTGPECVIPAA